MSVESVLLSQAVEYSKKLEQEREAMLCELRELRRENRRLRHERKEVERIVSGKRTDSPDAGDMQEEAGPSLAGAFVSHGVRPRDPRDGHEKEGHP